MQKRNQDQNNINNFIIIHISVDLNWASRNEAQTIQNQNSCKKIAVIFKDFSRTTLDFQGLPTRNVNHRFVHKCTFPVQANRTSGLICLLHQFLYIFQFTYLKSIANSCIKHKTLYVNHLKHLWAIIYALSWTTKRH